jgi:hypothetical protein
MDVDPVVMAIFAGAAGLLLAAYLVGKSTQLPRLRRMDGQLRRCAVDLATSLALHDVARGEAGTASDLFLDALRRVLGDIDSNSLPRPAPGGLAGGATIALALCSSATMFVTPPPWNFVIAGVTALGLAGVVLSVDFPGSGKPLAEDPEVDRFLRNGDESLRAHVRRSIERVAAGGAPR